MALSIGIVGLPNVGKSTLFNALTRLKAEASNYPFCTIDPNVGIVEVLDNRLDKLTEVVNPKKIIPTTIQFVDIAGLVKNAHSGEGLGNTFLSHIARVDAIIHMVRFFEDENVSHVEGQVDPARDIETIKMELILADLAKVEKRLENIKRQSKSGDKEIMKQLSVLNNLSQLLGQGQWIGQDPAWQPEALSDTQSQVLQELNLLTSKPVMYGINLPENEVGVFDEQAFLSKAGLSAEEVVVPLSAKVEQELIELSSQEIKEFLSDLGLEESSLVRLIHAGYRLLDLITYFTAGQKEVRAWTIKKNTKAPGAAGVIHSDFEKHFIRAEVVGWQDLVELGGYAGVRQKGKLRIEGKDYVVQDGDVMHFLHSAR